MSVRRVVAHAVVVTCALAGLGGSVAAASHDSAPARVAAHTSSGDGVSPTERPTHPPAGDLGAVDGGAPRHLPLPPGPGRRGPGGEMAAVQLDALGIPVRVLQAYHSAAQSEAYADPSCHLDWTLLAAIGRVESDHAHLGAVRTNGTAVPRILGPVLSGANGFAAISDTDNGRLDGNRAWDRAVGPMQFIPGSWALHGKDGNGDGRADPQNVDDAALATADYLCSGYRDLTRPKDLRWAIHGYNQSWAYVRAVLAWAKAYGAHVSVIPDAGPGKRKHHRNGRADRSRGTTRTGGDRSSTPAPVPATPTPTPTAVDRSTATPTETGGSTPSPTQTTSDCPSATASPDPTVTPDPRSSDCPTPTATVGTLSATTFAAPTLTPSPSG
jgi:hypothetical protein